MRPGDRCGAVPESPGAASTRSIPTGPRPQEQLEVYCGEPMDGDICWRARLQQRRVNGRGATLPFWKILYADRLAAKGSRRRSTHTITQPSPYIAGREYRDEIEETVDQLPPRWMRATTEGIDTGDMRPPHAGYGSAAMITSFVAIRHRHGRRRISTLAHQGRRLLRGRLCGRHQHFAGQASSTTFGADADEPIEDEASPALPNRRRTRHVVRALRRRQRLYTRAADLPLDAAAASWPARFSARRWRAVSDDPRWLGSIYDDGFALDVLSGGSGDLCVTHATGAFMRHRFPSSTPIKLFPPARRERLRRRRRGRGHAQERRHDPSTAPAPPSPGRA